MDYEKKYKEALERMKLWARGEHPECFTEAQKAAEFIFPELKENGDEKIKKDVKRAISVAFDYSYFDKETANNCLAWLEKQVPVDEEKVLIGARKDVALSIMDFLDRNTHGMCLSNMECKDLEDAVVDSDWSKVYDYMKKKLEKQGEPIDKVEPKFHKGEWIVWQDKFYKVNFNGCGYELIDQNGLHTSLEYGTVDENAHLWTIKDAREGDVVVCKGNIKNSNGIKYERICLFNNLDNAFFILTKTSNFVEEYDIDVNIDYPDNTIPATKEQKEILFMAMKGAGWEFNFEKKELKKVEQNCDCIELPTETPFGAYDSEFIEDTYFIPEGCYAEIVDDRVIIKKGDKKGECKSAWSEEDEHRAKDTIYFLDTAKKHYASTVELDACIDWLKSLKDKVQPQSQQEWSEEDETNFQGIMNEIKANKHEAPDYDIPIYYRYICWLESLKQRIGE